MSILNLYFNIPQHDLVVAFAAVEVRRRFP